MYGRQAGWLHGPVAGAGVWMVSAGQLLLSVCERAPRDALILRWHPGCGMDMYVPR